MTISTSVDPAGLEAVTVPVDEIPDLIAFAGSDGWLFSDDTGGIAGRGEALRINLPHGLCDPADVEAATEKLRSIKSSGDLGRPGCGPLALGALPFDPAEAGYLVVPAVVFGRDGDASWITTVKPVASADPAADPPADQSAAVGELSAAGSDSPPVLGGSSPERFTLTPTLSHAEWQGIVSAALDEIDCGSFEKVVLARRIDIEADRDFVVTEVLERLRTLYPSCMLFKMEGFIGASPELLVRRHGLEVDSHPLAGTVARSGDGCDDERLVASMMGSAKTRREHRVVVDAIAGALRPLCETLDVPGTPSVMSMRNVSHLASHIRGRLTADAPSVLGLAAAIHPTPAVGGYPTEPALRFLQKVEGFDRGRYAGPVGWIDSRGDGCFALGIRSAKVAGRQASIFAGNGIVAGSDPAGELTETQLKLQALLSALVRP
ncbi:MAG: isochorismate synthase [Acidimicrobiales bacterium]